MLSTDFVTGSPNWLDLASPDTAATASFYTAVFGWTYQSAGPEAGGYGFFQKDGRTVAALGQLTEEGASPAWTVYFRTPDADATAKAVEQGGGTVRVQPFDVMEAGRMACLTDPGSADFAVWQPGAFQGLEVASEHDALCWAELHVADSAAALAFYGSLFGWRSQEMSMPGMAYTVLSTADGDLQDSSFGGLAGVQEGMRPAWIPYFDAADADAVTARVQQAGGIVLMPAADVPEVGRIAWLADPFGAPFAIITPAPQAA
ncbi:putative enzyme related to lactoylglutathione lyase [Kitasatospora sp. MAA4]|uniref:VOC family protein n=1 Tax=Kitasatospora sp. MAA4 TaxID=3035093 RepID=UPI002473A926|nr:VOC family protein [Kitasatospora sp. MAA4]MDH6137864.1 putative enzyme related to lactoylglutathione lyase [Kitasatospora sp. MAA4]